MRLGLPLHCLGIRKGGTYREEIAVVMVEDALEVGRVLPGDLLLHLTSSLLLPALEVPLQDDQSLCVSTWTICGFSSFHSKMIDLC